MTPKQERFVAEYVVDLNATQAAIRAGYSEATAKQIGSRLLTNVDVKRAIAERTSKSLAKLQITAEDIAREAWNIAVDRECQPSARVSALSLLSKQFREFSDKHEVSGDISLRVEALAAVATMTPEQLKALAENARS